MLRRRARRNTGATLPVTGWPENQTKRQLKHHCLVLKLYLLTSGIVLALVVVGGYSVHHFALSEYAWVHRRCLKPWFKFDTETKVECVEAMTHKLAILDQSLSGTARKQIMIPTKTNTNQTHDVASIVHYTVTTPLQGSTLELALCSLEATGRLCQDRGCVINVWIVDQAKVGINNGTWFRDMQDTLDSYQYCLRTVSSTIDIPDQMIGTKCIRPKLCAYANPLRKWLTSSLARQQLPAHISDAWRLVALYEMGGLYFDADVLPLSSDIMYLPSPTIPTQQSIGAYRLNGGTLRMNAHVCGNNHSDTGAPTTFLDALVHDHLEWAPLLAVLPQSSQTFGFLGPCALTRVYTSHRYSDMVTILPPELLEPEISTKTICNEPHLLAIHFSGYRKNQWQRLMELSSSRTSCLRTLVSSACPRTLDKLSTP